MNELLAKWLGSLVRTGVLAPVGGYLVVHGLTDQSTADALMSQWTSEIVGAAMVAISTVWSMIQKYRGALKEKALKNLPANPSREQLEAEMLSISFGELIGWAKRPRVDPRVDVLADRVGKMEETVAEAVAGVLSRVAVLEQWAQALDKARAERAV